MQLLVHSFHSVKGGVGKSTLATLAALYLARAKPDLPVYLIDMDLTGTSLADVLPLEAPSWVEGETIDLLTPPLTFLDRDASRASIEERQAMLSRIVSAGQAPDRGTALHVPFLNDFLWFATPDWDEQTDVHPRAIAWRMQDGPDNLRVFPSSALPADLERTLPLIFDEERAAFLEARLEYLLAALLQEHGNVAVVFDTPPTIPGLSRSILSLAFRLGGTEKISLVAGDDHFPWPLDEAQVRWQAFLVATTDLQDVRAAARWLSLTQPHERAILTPLLNRAPRADRMQLNEFLESTLREIGAASFRDPLIVGENSRYQFFKDERVPSELRDLMTFMERPI